jgi:hypothetical protein
MSNAWHGVPPRPPPDRERCECFVGACGLPSLSLSWTASDESSFSHSFVPGASSSRCSTVMDDNHGEAMDNHGASQPERARAVIDQGASPRRQQRGSTTTSAIATTAIVGGQQRHLLCPLPLFLLVPTILSWPSAFWCIQCSTNAT